MWLQSRIKKKKKQADITGACTITPDKTIRV